MNRAKIDWRRPLAMHVSAYEDLFDERPVADAPGFETKGNAAVVTIRGPLLSRPGGFWSLFCDDYESIRKRAADALASPSARLVLRIDSPGGDANGCLELARELRAMAAAAGKPLEAFGEGMVASAAYAIASSADRVYAAPTALIGSIGCITELVDCTALDAAIGVVVRLISSGVRKTDGNPHIPTSDEAIERTLAMINELADLFFGVVSDHRGIRLEALRALEGGLFVGASAIGPGLVDSVATWEDVIAGMAGVENALNPKAATSKKNFDSAKEALRAVVDDESCSAEEREKARKSLRALEAEADDKDGEGGEKKDDKKEEGARAEGEGEGGEKKDDKDKKEGMRAAAPVAAPAMQSAAEVAEVARKAASEEWDRRAKVQAEAQEVKDLLATRPDFDASMRATLAKLPVADVKAAVEKWPRRPVLSPAAGATTMPTTQGDKQGDLDHALDPDTTALLNRIMKNDGARAPKADPKTGEVVSASSSFDPDLASKHLAEMTKGAGQ